MRVKTECEEVSYKMFKFIYNVSVIDDWMD